MIADHGNQIDTSVLSQQISGVFSFVMSSSKTFTQWGTTVQKLGRRTGNKYVEQLIRLEGRLKPCMGRLRQTSRVCRLGLFGKSK